MRQQMLLKYTLKTNQHVQHGILEMLLLEYKTLGQLKAYVHLTEIRDLGVQLKKHGDLPQMEPQIIA